MVCPTALKHGDYMLIVLTARWWQWSGTAHFDHMVAAQAGPVAEDTSIGLNAWCYIHQGHQHLQNVTQLHTTTHKS
jgi:hypothetical protein